MNATARTARRIVKARRNETKAHKQGLHTLASHAIRAGVNETDASGVAGALRSKAKTVGVCGHTALMVRKTDNGVRPVKGAKRFTKAEFLTLATAYNPRAAKYVAARQQLLNY
jgi:hypothetical protein